MTILPPEFGRDGGASRPYRNDTAQSLAGVGQRRQGERGTQNGQRRSLGKEVGSRKELGSRDSPKRHHQLTWIMARKVG